MPEDRIKFKEAFNDLEKESYDMFNLLFTSLLDFIGIEKRIKSIILNDDFQISEEVFSNAYKKFGNSTHTIAYFKNECKESLSKYKEEFESSTDSIGVVDVLINNTFFRYISNVLIISFFNYNKFKGGFEVEYFVFEQIAKMNEVNRGKALAHYIFSYEVLLSYCFFKHIYKKSVVKSTFGAKAISNREVLFSFCNLSKNTFKQFLISRNKSIDLFCKKRGVTKQESYTIITYFFTGTIQKVGNVENLRSFYEFYLINRRYLKFLAVNSLQKENANIFNIVMRKKDIIRFLNLVKEDYLGEFYYDKMYKYCFTEKEEQLYKSSDIVEFCFFEKLVFRALEKNSWKEVFEDSGIVLKKL